MLTINNNVHDISICTRGNFRDTKLSVTRMTFFKVQSFDIFSEVHLFSKYRQVETVNLLEYQSQKVSVLYSSQFTVR